MAEFHAHLRTEWRQLVRGPLLWVMALAGAGLWWLMRQATEDLIHYGYVLNQYSFLYIGPISIIAVLAGTHEARKDRVLGLDKITGSIAYSTAKLNMARFIVVSLPLVVIASIPALQLILALQTPEAAEAALKFILIAVVGILYAAAAGWFLAIWARGRIAYFLGIAFWFIHIYGGLFAVEAIPANWYGLSVFMLGDLRSLGYYDDFWGLISDITFWLHRAFYLSLCALLFLAMVFVPARRRREPLNRKISYPLTLVVIFAVIGTLYGYVGIREERLLQAQALEQKVEDDLNHFHEIAADFKVNQYKLSVSLTEKSQIRVLAAMEVQPLHDGAIHQLSFTLKDLFELEEILINDQPAAIERTRHWLHSPLSTPLEKDQTVQVKMLYQGEINDMRVFYPYGSNPGTILYPAYAANEDKLFLAGNYGWYPIPGHHLLQRIGKMHSGLKAKEIILDAYPQAEPSDYHVTVEYPNTVTLFSTGEKLKESAADNRQIIEFRAEQADGFSLFGGDLQEIRAEDNQEIRAIVHTLMSKEHTKQILNEAVRTISEIRRVVEMPSEAGMRIIPIDPIRGIGNMVLAGNEMPQFRSNQLGGAVTVNGYSMYQRESALPVLVLANHILDEVFPANTAFTSFLAISRG